MAPMNSIVSIATAGLNASTARFDASAKRVAQDPHADLPAELVTQKTASLDFEANIAVMKTANKMAKSVLDILV